MNNIEMYMDYLDNRLTPDQEIEFASLLASDTEFREGFKNYLKLTGALTSSVQSFMPDADLKASVFAAVGLPNNSTDFENNNNEEDKNRRAFIMFFNNKYFYSAMACAVLGISSILLLNPPYDNKLNDLSLNDKTLPKVANINDKNQTEIANNHTAVSSKSTSASRLNKSASLSLTKKERSLNSKQLDLTSNNNQTIVEDKNEKINTAISLYEYKQINESAYSHYSNSKTSNTLPINTNGIIPVFELISSSSNNLGLYVEFTKSESKSIFDVNVQPAKANSLNNLSLNILKEVSSEFKFGLSVKQETFYVKYDQTDYVNADFYQQPNLTTISAVARFYPVDFSSSLKTYVQTDLGINKVGGIIRGKVGIEFSFTDNYYMTLSGDYGELVFQHNNKIFTSDKVSLNYGIGVKF
eukprot:TRINITY_DN20119_c0_g1_i1.p1 TRINITY_DN20119_c0_g1~~TRINITY_DN20119_c0_g1_i1.p1  ORF type:complete len:412 (+),score=-49.72 TRINITY_DN20119_c0_g1_i1:633-1868(+)